MCSQPGRHPAGPTELGVAPAGDGGVVAGEVGGGGRQADGPHQAGQPDGPPQSQQRDVVVLAVVLVLRVQVDPVHQHVLVPGVRVVVEVEVADANDQTVSGGAGVRTVTRSSA